jgi:hypothetical protein
MPRPQLNPISTEPISVQKIVREALPKLGPKIKSITNLRARNAVLIFILCTERYGNSKKKMAAKFI